MRAAINDGLYYVVFNLTLNFYLAFLDAEGI